MLRASRALRFDRPVEKIRTGFTGLRVVANAPEVLESVLVKLQSTAAGYDQVGNLNRAMSRSATHRLNIIRALPEKTSAAITEAFDGVQTELLIEQAEGDLAVITFINEEAEGKPWEPNPEGPAVVDYLKSLNFLHFYDTGRKWLVDEAILKKMMIEHFGTDNHTLLFDVDMPNLPESTKLYQDKLRAEVEAQLAAEKAQKEKEAAEAASAQ